VADLDREIRFKHFHGIDDKPNPDAIRDKVLEEWVTELLLRHEADELGFDERPEIVAAAEWLERDLVRDHVVNMILDVKFEPGPGEIEEYYAEHRDELTPTPRVRADGVLLADEESAREFRSMVEGGAGIGWLAQRTPAVRDPDPAFLADWLPADALGLSAGDLEEGRLFGPVPSGGAWLVARIQDVESVGPPPLDQCVNQVVARMRNEARLKSMRRALERLEAEAEIEIVEGAYDLIADHIDEWLGSTAAADSR
jgi:peptidyl-prolyl cis-trans isomerase C